METPDELAPKTETVNNGVTVVGDNDRLLPQKMTDSELGNLVGMVRVPTALLKTLSAIGVESEGIGVLKIAGGSALFTQQELIRAVSQLSNIINDPKTEADRKMKAAYPLGYLCDKLTKAISTSVEIAEVEPSAGNPGQPNAIPRRSRSFQPGIYVDKAQFIVEKPPQKP